MYYVLCNHSHRHGVIPLCIYAYSEVNLSVLCILVSICDPDVGGAYTEDYFVADVTFNDYGVFGTGTISHLWCYGHKPYALGSSNILKCNDDGVWEEVDEDCSFPDMPHQFIQCSSISITFIDINRHLPCQILYDYNHRIPQPDPL